MNGEQAVAGSSLPRAAPVIVLPVEGSAVARLDSASYEDECRLAHDLWHRSLLIEVGAALERLRAALEEMTDGATS